MFHATLATFLLICWMLVFLSPNPGEALRYPTPAAGSAIALLFGYGGLVTAVLAGLFWYETIGILKKERI